MSRRHIESGERRRSVRVGTCGPVHLRAGLTYCTGRLVDLSVAGALVRADSPVGAIGSELSLGLPSGRGDETCWLLALACRCSSGMLAMRWHGQPPFDVMLRIHAMIGRELDPLRPAEARLAALRARALLQGD